MEKQRVSLRSACMHARKTWLKNCAGGLLLFERAAQACGGRRGRGRGSALAEKRGRLWGWMEKGRRTGGGRVN